MLTKIPLPPRKLEVDPSRNNVLTASRMGSIMRCPRMHYWQYEIGLRKADTSQALSVGSAWARAMEARWNGFGYEAALSDALTQGVALDETSAAVVAGLLHGYYQFWGANETMGQLKPEVQFKSDLAYGFTVQGKIDGLGSLSDGRSTLLEAKTTAASVEPQSDYWTRLAFNMQVYQYVSEAMDNGWEISCAFYDVVHKPGIKPTEVPDLDEEGRKIVVDANGERVMNLAGKNKGEPRQTADKEKGYVLKTHMETPEEYAGRLAADIAERPSFYFARKEVPILHDQVEEFKLQRLAIAKMILAFRENERSVHCQSSAWPRNVSEMTCKFCSYQSFCLSNVKIDLASPPEGFSVQPFNPELEKIETENNQ